MLHRLFPSTVDNFCYWKTVDRGFSVIDGAGWEHSLRDVGRSDRARIGTTEIELHPLPNSDISMCNVRFTIKRADGAVLKETLPYSHRGLLKLCTDYDFETVLDIGSHEGHAARILRFLGKRVTTTEIVDCYDADYRGDYLDISFPAETFDAIWASHVLEHQRNAGAFLDKVFHDLKVGGVLAVTVPVSNPGALEFGHVNIFNPFVLLYQLVLAGFDCRQASVSSYNAMTTVIVRKRPNGISRISFAQYPNGLPGMAPHHFFPALKDNFPFSVENHGRAPGHIREDINW